MKNERRWPQQPLFADRVKEYCAKNGLLTIKGAIKMDVVADLFNLNEDTLRQMLQDSTRKRPQINTLTHIAGVIRCSVTEFIDAPGDPTPGMSKEKWSGLSTEERAVATKLLKSVGSDELSIAEKEELYSIYRAAEKSLLRLKKK